MLDRTHWVYRKWNRTRQAFRATQCGRLSPPVSSSSLRCASPTLLGRRATPSSASRSADSFPGSSVMPGGSLRPSLRPCTGVKHSVKPGHGWCRPQGKAHSLGLHTSTTHPSALVLRADSLTENCGARHPLSLSQHQTRADYGSQRPQRASIAGWLSKGSDIADKVEKQRGVHQQAGSDDGGQGDVGVGSGVQ